VGACLSGVALKARTVLLSIWVHFGFTSKDGVAGFTRGFADSISAMKLYVFMA
jgi:hypothetical protein